MGKQDAEQAIDADRLLEAEPAQAGIEEALASPDLDQPECADENGQAERQRHQPQQPDPAEETRPPRQRPRHRYREEHGQQSGKACLQQREAGDAPDIGVEQSAFVRAAGLGEQGGDRQADEEQEGAEANRPGDNSHAVFAKCEQSGLSSCSWQQATRRSRPCGSSRPLPMAAGRSSPG
ncbi:hypothetical protein D9M72_549160 [compost metagenome]